MSMANSQQYKQFNIGLSYFAKLCAASAFFLLIAGGLVTSTGSGLSVPDWPLSFGQFFPPMKGGVFFEHGHRIVAGLVGILTLILSLWIQLCEKRNWVRILAWITSGVVILQALLGGITVLYSLPPLVSILHACMGQIFFCLLVALSEITSFRWLYYQKMLNKRIGLSILYLGILCFITLFLQLIIGAIFRHTGNALMWHIIGAWVGAFIIVWLCAQIISEYKNDSFLSLPAICLIGLIVFQIFIGATTAIIKLSPSGQYETFFKQLIPTLHVVCGALLLAFTIVLTLRAYRLNEGIS